MPNRPRGTKRPPVASGEDRVLEAIRAGFAGQARTSAKILTAIHRTNENLDAFSQNVDRMLLQISRSIDGLTEGLLASSARLHEAMLEQGRRIEENNRRIEEQNRRLDEQGARLEGIGRRIDENTAAVRENTGAIVRLAEAIRRMPGNGQPGGRA